MAFCRTLISLVLRKRSGLQERADLLAVQMHNWVFDHDLVIRQGQFCCDNKAAIDTHTENSTKVQLKLSLTKGL